MTPPTAPDGMDFPDRAPSSALPTDMADALRTGESELVSVASASAQAVVDTVASIEREIRLEQMDSNRELMSLFGTIDMELVEALHAHQKTVVSLLDAATRGVYTSQEELRAAGVPMTSAIDEMRADMSDESGERIFTRLMGRAPESAYIPPPPMPPPDLPPDRLPAPQPVAQFPAHPQPVAQLQTPIEEPDDCIPALSNDGYTQYGCEPEPPPPPPPENPCPPGFAPPYPGHPRCYPVEPEPPVPPPAPPVPPLFTCPPPVVSCPTPSINVAPASVTCPDNSSAIVEGMRAIAGALTPPPPPPTAPGSLPQISAQWGSQGYGLTWSGRDVCQQIERTVSYRAPGTPGGTLPSGEPAVRAINGPADVPDAMLDFTRRTIGRLNSLLPGGLTGESAASLVGEIGAFTLGAYAVEPLMAALNPLSVPYPEATGRFVATLGMATFAERNTGMPLDYLMQTERYLMQYLAPQYLPDQSGLDAAWLRSTINTDQWTCLTASLGNIPETSAWALDAHASRPGISEVIELRMRGLLKDDKLFRARMRQLGVVNADHDRDWIALAQWIPQPPDIVRFMVRDVFDEDAVKRAGLDTDFEQKFYGGPVANPDAPAAKWAAAHGLTEDLFRWQWRAHWELPSPTQLYEMLHRLRPDRPEVDEWEKATAGAESGAEPSWPKARPPVVTEDDARAMLQQQDLAPAWIDRLMAVSYRPMTRTDALGAFHANVMDAAELTERLRDTGLDLQTAKRTVELQESLRARRMANVSGVWTVRKIAKAYGSGALGWVDAFELLAPIMPDDDMRRQLLSGVDAEQTAALREKRIARYRRRHITGETDSARGIEDLRILGIAPDKAAQMVATWSEERDGRYKEVSARMIADWVKHRIVSSDAATERLLRLGYALPDVIMMVSNALVTAEGYATGQQSKLRSEGEHIIKDEKAARRATARELTAREREIARQQEKLIRELARIRGELSDRTGE